MKILILGGYGTFGGRLAELLSNTQELTLIIAGRSESKAIQFIKKLSPGSKKMPLAFDRNADVEKQLCLIKPDLLIDATGPFQLYGDDPYRVIKACISQQVNYMDLADGVQFVNGVVQFDDAAKKQNLYVLSGVSSFPVLTAAVVRKLARDFKKVTAIKGGIAPSPYAGVGLNVLYAISDYAGKSVEIIRDGKMQCAYALTDTFDYTIAPPGYLPLRNRCFSLFDVPDLQALPKLWPELDSIWMGAAPVPAFFHWALRMLSWLVRLRLLPSLSLLAPLFHFVSNTIRWGEHRGGMFVSIQGTTGIGESIERSWHLVAEGDDGPYIPSMAIEGIVRKSLKGTLPRAGARPCTDDLELTDYDLLFKNRSIHTGEREQNSESVKPYLYREVLGSSWDSLPTSLKLIHERNEDLSAQGLASVERGNGFFSALVATAFGFPNACKEIPVAVSFTLKNNIEHWRRTFGEKSFSSTQARGTTQGLISERFGPFSFDLALVVKDEKLNFIVRDWFFFGIRLPRILAPAGNSYEFEEDGQFHFHVEVAHPIFGLIVRYRGFLIPR